MRFNPSIGCLLIGWGIFLLSPKETHGQVIGANFTGVNSSGGNTAYSMNPSDSPGVVYGTNYTNLNSGSGSAFITDSTGVYGFTLTWRSTDQYSPQNYPNTPNAATNTMYTGSLYGDPTKNGEPSITLANVPFSTYAVYVYASADGSNSGNAPTNPPSITDGTTTYYYRGLDNTVISGNEEVNATSLTLTTSTNPSAPTLGDAQYQVFYETNSAPVTISEAGSVNDAFSNNLFGLEVVNTSSAPEPASIALMTLGASGLLFRRRRAL